MIGTTLQRRYRLDSQIGHGGMGIVYRGHDTLLDRPVAIKVLSESRLGTQGRARLLNEARAVARLNHRNIVTVYDAGESDGSPFIVMELVEGLALNTQPPRETCEIVDLARQICAALDHAHTHGVIHRDLKPENVLVTPDGTLKLMDFGLARSVASRVTTEGTIVGTVFYLAPELALGQPFDGRTDLYALGVMLYEWTTGQLPFTADDPLAIISQHLYAPVVPPRAHNPDIPPALEALIVELLNKQPSDRPASAAIVQQRLEQLDSAPLPETLVEPSLLDRIARGRFVARQHELAQAEAYWQRARNGQGQLLLVSGEPGIGKTRFVREVMAQAQVSGGRALKAECYADMGAPYSPVAQLLREAFDDPSLEHVGLSEVNLADLITLAPELRARYPHVPPNPPLEPQAEQQRVFESMVAWCTAMAAQSPLLLFLDDVHWADSATLALLRHLARRTRKLRLLLIASYRDMELDEAMPWNQVLLDLNRERLATRIKLLRLSCQETGELVSTMFQQELGEDFLDGVYCETEGNPFFVEEVCKALVEEGKICFGSGCWHLPGMDELEIPQSVRLTIQARVGKLPSEAQDTLRLAAILGREFDFGTLRHASDLDEDALIGGLELAQRAQLIEEVPGKNQHVIFAFAHALIRLTLYESIGVLRRPRLHRRAADALETVHPDDYERIAKHYQRAGEVERARAYYARAGERALTVNAFEEAEGNFRAALELDGSDVERVRALTGLGDALAPGGRFEEAIQTWREAIQLARALKDYDQVAQLYTRASRTAWVEGDLARGLALAREGLEAVAGQAETPALASLLHETGRACFFNGRPSEARPLCDRALDIARRLNVVQVQAEALTTLGLLYGVEHQYAQEEQAYLEAIPPAEAACLWNTAARAHHNLANLLTQFGRLQEAVEHAQRAVELNHKAGHIANELFSLRMVAFNAMHMGDAVRLDRAVEESRQLANQMTQVGVTSDQSRFIEAVRLHYRGEWSQEIDLLMQVRAEAREQGDYQTVNSCANLLADAYAWVDRLAEAEALLKENVRALSPVGSGSDDYGQLCAIYSRQARIEQARQALAGIQNLASAQPIFGEQLLRGLAEARIESAEKNWAASFANYGSCVRLLEEKGLPWLGMRTLIEWAAACHARGEPADRAQAHALLSRALDFCKRNQAPGYVALVQSQLDALAHS